MIDQTSLQGGNSRIELDLKLLNSLLEIFVNKPDQAHFQVNSLGCLEVEHGDLKISLNPVQVQQLFSLSLQKGTMKAFKIDLQQILLDAQGLKVSMQLRV